MENPSYAGEVGSGEEAAGEITRIYPVTAPEGWVQESDTGEKPSYAGKVGSGEEAAGEIIG
ncbi:hypothetical protein [Paenibacillus marinisediminis]